ncbi:MAG TPA: DUF4262 domain-containing protein [Flavobacteriales bacterium]|nr:DUF4262 domain-containing protein [Flavobacteriales bacterium]
MEEDQLNEQESISDCIKKQGFYSQLFLSSGYLPQFGYSIGFFETYGHPEIICFGLDLDLIDNIIQNAHRQIKLGMRFEKDTSYGGFLEGYDIVFIDVMNGHQGDWVGYDAWYFKERKVPCLQLIWPDKNRKWPWEEEYNEDWKFIQPLLNRSPNYKFLESKNTGVLADKGLFDGTQSIVSVIHDSEGEWTFLSQRGFNPTWMEVYCLENVIRQDTTLNEVFNMNYGKQAVRNEKGGDWEYMLFEFGEDEE